MNIDGATLFGLVLAGGLVLYALLRGGEYAWVELSRQGKARVIWWDQDGGVKITFHERRGNEITAAPLGGAVRPYLLDGAARLPGRYPTWVIHPRHGWNFLALSDSETVNADSILQKLAISNPAMHHNAVARNKAADAMKANDPEDRWGWVTPVAIGGVVCIVVLVGMVGWIVVTLSNQGGG